MFSIYPLGSNLYLLYPAFCPRRLTGVDYKYVFFLTVGSSQWETGWGVVQEERGWGVNILSYLPGQTQGVGCILLPKALVLLQAGFSYVYGYSLWVLVTGLPTCLDSLVTGPSTCKFKQKDTHSDQGSRDCSGSKERGHPTQTRGSNEHQRCFPTGS